MNNNRSLFESSIKWNYRRLKDGRIDEYGSDKSIIVSLGMTRMTFEKIKYENINEKIGIVEKAALLKLVSSVQWGSALLDFYQEAPEMTK